MLVAGIMLILLPGCSYHGPKAAWSESHPLADDLEVYQPPQKSSAPVDSRALIEPSETIDLNQVLALALMHNPELAGYAYQVRSAEARAMQAGMIPNPEFEIEMEEIGDNGLDDMVASFLLSQQIELGGKRKKRTQLARLEAAAVGWEYEMIRLDVFTRTKKAFAEVIATQERVALSLEMVDLSEQMLKVISDRVAAGRDSPIEEARALTALASSKIEWKKAESDLITAKRYLASQWGNSAPVFENAQGDLSVLKPAPPFSELSARVSQNPDIARWDAIIEQSQKALALEKAMRIPDLALGAGLEYSNAEREKTYRLGLAFPIPLFDRNQGGLREAQSNLLSAEKAREAATVCILAELTEAFQLLATSYDEAIILLSDVLPTAEQALKGSRDGFSMGKYSYLEVIDAQRTLFEVKSQYLEALVTYHSARADVERLIAEPLDESEHNRGDDHEK